MNEQSKRPTQAQREALLVMADHDYLIDVYRGTKRPEIRWLNASGNPTYERVTGIGEASIDSMAAAGWIVETPDGYTITPAGRAALTPPVEAVDVPPACPHCGFSTLITEPGATFCENCGWTLRPKPTGSDDADPPGDVRQGANL